MGPCTMQPHDARILLEDLTTIDLKTASFHMYHATWEFTWIALTLANQM